MGTLRDKAVENFTTNLIYDGENRIEQSRKFVVGKDFDLEFAREQLEGEKLHRRYEAELAKRLGIDDYEEFRSMVDDVAAAADVEGWIGRAAEKLAKLKAIDE